MEKVVKSHLAQNEIDALIFLKKELVNKYIVKDFRVFGSKARGDSTLESDLDVMIRLDKRNFKIELSISELIFIINLKFDTFISAILFDDFEIENGPMSESPLYKLIQIEGIPVEYS